MTIFSEANEDSKYGTIEDAAQGPRHGFLDSFEAAYNSHVKGASQFAVEEGMFNLERDQYRAMKNAGIEDAPALSPYSVDGLLDFISPPGPNTGVDVYKDVAKFVSQGGTPEQAERIKMFDDKIEEIRDKYPDLGLRTSAEMFARVKSEAQQAEQHHMTMRQNLTGMIGDFAGGTVASMNPSTDPFNFYTLGVGGVGKTAVKRIATQAGAQGVIETINQFTGVQESREMLGLNSGFADAATRVLSTAAGGAAIQGLGEAVAKGVSVGGRWFRNTKDDPAPLALPAPGREQRLLEYNPSNVDVVRNTIYDTPHFDAIRQASPFPDTREGRVRTKLDVDYVDRVLDAWDGPDPADIKPYTSTSIPKPISEFVAPDIRVEGPGKKDLDQLAREIDPQLFTKYDQLAQRNQEYRRWLGEMRPNGDKVNDMLSGLIAQVDELSDIVNNPKTKSRARKKAQKELDELLLSKEEQTNKILSTDTPEMAKVRREILSNDFKMREMAPLVSRAYARAQDKWSLGEGDRELIKQMVRTNNTKLPRNPLEGAVYEDVAPTYPRTLEDRVPILRNEPATTEGVRPGADAADRAMAILKKHEEIYNQRLEGFRGSIKTALDPNAKAVTIPGVETKVQLSDEIVVPGEKGKDSRTLTVREYLLEQQENELDLEAVKTCSIR